MRVLEPRKRLINFRLSEQEYLHLKQACSNHGGRCLSEFARAAILEMADSQTLLKRSTESRLLRLEQRLAGLEHSVGRVLAAVERLGPPALSRGESCTP